MTPSTLRALAADLRTARDIADWPSLAKELERIAWALVPSEYEDGARRDLARLRANLRAAVELGRDSPAATTGYVNAVAAELDVIAGRQEKGGVR